MVPDPHQELLEAINELQELVLACEAVITWARAEASTEALMAQGAELNRLAMAAWIARQDVEELHVQALQEGDHSALPRGTTDLVRRLSDRVDRLKGDASPPPRPPHGQVLQFPGQPEEP